MSISKSDMDVPSQMQPAYKYRAYCERVIDGDTYWLRVDLGFHAALTIPVRLHGVDTPEMNTPEGKAAREFVLHILRPGDVHMDPYELGEEPTQLIIESYRDRQSFARWIADVYVAEGGESLAHLLLQEGHAVPMER